VVKHYRPGRGLATRPCAVDDQPANPTLLAEAEEKPALRKVDFARLDQRADDQRKRVESLRIQAARDAFARAKSGG
jgi:transaldolase